MPSAMPASTAWVLSMPVSSTATTTPSPEKSEVSAFPDARPHTSWASTESAAIGRINGFWLTSATCAGSCPASRFWAEAALPPSNRLEALERPRQASRPDARRRRLGSQVAQDHVLPHAGSSRLLGRMGVGGKLPCPVAATERIANAAELEPIRRVQSCLLQVRCPRRWHVVSHHEAQARREHKEASR